MSFLNAYDHSRGTCGVAVIVIVDGIGSLGSNPERDCWCFTFASLPLGSLSLLPSAMSK